MSGSLVQSVERALHILLAFHDGETALSLSEISRRVGLSPSTTHRLLQTLLAHKFVEQLPNNQYSLGIRLLELGRLVQCSSELRQIATPAMRQLAATTGHTISLFVPSEDEALCLERISGRNPIQILAVDVGGRLPLNCGAGPRVLLAGLPDTEIQRLYTEGRFRAFTDYSLIKLEDILADAHQTRSQGYALAIEDVVPRVGAIAAPLRDASGQWVGAISLVGILPDFDEVNQELFTQELIKAAGAISAQLGYRQPTSEPAG